MPTQQAAALSGVRRVSTTAARRDFADLLNRVAYGDEEVIIERHGKPLAALVSAERLEELEAVEDAMDGLAADRAAGEGGFIDAEAFFSEMDRG